MQASSVDRRRGQCTERQMIETVVSELGSCLTKEDQSNA